MLKNNDLTLDVLILYKLDRYPQILAQYADDPIRIFHMVNILTPVVIDHGVRTGAKEKPLAQNPCKWLIYFAPLIGESINQIEPFNEHGAYYIIRL